MANGLAYTRKMNSADAIKQLGATLAPYLRPGDLIILSGELGAGKTQLVQGIAAALGIKAPVTSPTFNIMLSYGGGRIPLYHFDLYRLNDPSELDDIDYYAYIDSDSSENGVVCVEWGEKFPEALPCDYLEIAIEPLQEGQRKIHVHSYGARARQLLFVWASDSKAHLSQITEGS